jgi:hypothetical protein
MDGISGKYLDSTAEQRAEIRKQFGRDTLFYLYEYAERVAAQLRITNDPEFLSLGLAAISIEDLRGDYRDTLVCLGELWLAGETAGLDPWPYFEAIARGSNTEPRDVFSSTRDLISSFPETAYYKECKSKFSE